MRRQLKRPVPVSHGDSALIAAFLAAFGWSVLPTLAGDLAEALPLKYEVPASLTGTIYDATGTNVLFEFKRTATRAGTNLTVLREYTAPDGKVAGRETVSYQGDQLLTYTLDDVQTGANGSAKILREPSNPPSGKIEFNYLVPRGQLETATESLRPDTLTSDMVGPFLSDHWTALISGREVKCRYLVVPRMETVGFTFTRTAETSWRGKPVVVIRMAASSWVVGLKVDPLFFKIEKNGQHRILQYTGRVTPKIKTKTGWKDLDAVTVFDWQ
jgi:hypothetical protein